MLGKLDDTLRFHETALSLRAQRQQLLASNIANADTPQFKARDFDFSQALQQALHRAGPAASPSPSPSHAPQLPAAMQVSVQGMRSGQMSAASAASAASAYAGLAKTSAAHLSGNGANAIGSLPMQYRVAAQGSVDGNTVDMDAERSQFADNALRYEAGLTLISGQIKNLLTAIQGQ